jgi:hypothetical protein
MSPQTEVQTVVEEAPKKPATMNATIDMMESIISATARQQYEQAVADRYMAQTYAKGAGMSEEDARTIIALGRDYGWGPAHALTRLFMQGGRPRLFAEARANMLAQAGYKWFPVTHNETECTYQFKYKGEWMLDVNDKPLRVSFTMKNAEKAGYIQNSRGKDGKTGNYDKIPENMLFARMITNFHKWHAAEVDGATLADPNELLEAVVAETEKNIAAKSVDKVEELKERLQNA